MRFQIHLNQYDDDQSVSQLLVTCIIRHHLDEHFFLNLLHLVMKLAKRAVFLIET